LIEGNSWEDALRSPKASRQVFRAGRTQSIGKEAA